MNRTTLVSAIALLSLIGCAPSIKITKEFLDPDFSFGQIGRQSKIRVFVSGAVTVTEFKNSFSKEYQSEQQFSSVLQKQIADSMKTILGCSADPSGTMQDASMLQSAGFDEKSVNQIQQLFGSAAENYFFVITSVEITHRVTSNGPVFMTSPGGGGTLMSGGNSSESCVVILHADLWSVKEKRKMLTCSSTGDSQVTLLFYGTALKAAVANSVEYLVKYLATGLTT
jgi:hypothetical protein